jgi:hypothetical protein
LAVCLWAFLLAGCAGYRLGPAGGQIAGARSIQVNPFFNKTLEPRISDYTMISLRQQLIQDGTYRLDSHGEGDLILNGTILKYERSEISVNPADVLTALDYDITMTAHVTVKERSSGKIIFNKDVKGRTSLRAGTDLTSAERQALPQLTDDFAKRAITLLVDGTW